jgi:hypothetical protein
MKFHLEGLVLKDTSKDRVLSEEVNSSIKTIRTLNKNMMILSDKINDIMTNDPNNMSAILPLMSELRQTVGELRLFSAYIQD